MVPALMGVTGSGTGDAIWSDGPAFRRGPATDGSGQQARCLLGAGEGALRTVSRLTAPVRVALAETRVRCVVCL